MRGFLLALMLLASSFNVTYGCDEEGKTGFMPENNLWITPGNSLTEMTEEEFDQIIDRIEEIYSPVVDSEGANLKIVRKWKDGTVNAYAQRQGNTWKVTMFGGMARHQFATNDGFALVVCHELGHHLGGAPKKSGWFGKTMWASNEGQSDYWGSMKCLRKYMEKDDNAGIVANMDIPKVVSDKCRENFSNENDIAMCERGSMAGLALGKILNSLGRSGDEVDFSTPSRSVVSSTDHNHPKAQCRLDTYFAGSVCERDHYSDVSNSDANQAVCNRAEEDKEGLRPLCWYKPPRS